MNKTPLLLIPGLLCDQALWGAQQTALADIANMVIADTTQDSSIVDMATRAHQQMTERFPDRRYAVAGLSMGGYIALEMWQQHAATIERLALLDTRANLESAEHRRQRERLMRTVRFHQRFVGMSDDQLPRYIHPDRIADTELVETIRAMTQRVGKAVYLQQQQAILGRVDRMDKLSSIDVPTLVICGANDALTPLACSQALAERILGANLVVIPDCGHLSTLEKPDQVSAELRQWLAS